MRRGVIETSEPFEPEREAERMRGAEVEAARAAKTGDAMRIAKADKKLKRTKGRAKSAIVGAISYATGKGAAVPTLEASVKRSWRVERIEAPPGSEAPPAYVVRFEGNSPLARLMRSARGCGPALDDLHVRAADRLRVLHDAAVHSPKLTGSYDGVVAGGGATAPWVDVHSDAWRLLTAAMDELLPVEREIVVAVVVHETPLEAIARRGLGPISKAARASGAALQTLRLGLERLARHWGLDAGDPHNVTP